MQDDEGTGNTAGAGAQPLAGGEGAPPSNTAPANCNEKDTPRIYRVGIDSLYLSCAGHLSLETDLKLKTLKALAQSGTQDEALAVLAMKGHRFQVWSKGSGLFPYVLSDDAFYIKLAGSGSSKLPLAYVQLKSDYLMTVGIEKACAELTEIIREFGEVEGTPCVSRADLCVDFVTDHDLRSLTINQFVTRARSISVHTVDRVFSGYSIGQGSDLSARLYDKTMEIEESGKHYYKEIWKSLGWSWEMIVFRLEYQLKRRILAEHGITTVSDLLQRQGALWRYLTTHWLKVTNPSPTDTTQSRWPLHPLWDALSKVEWPQSQEGVSFPIRSESVPSDDYLFGAGMAGITAFMAREGITDPEEAFRQFSEKARHYHNARWHITGQDYEGAMQEKAANKARQYHLPYPGIDEKRDQKLSYAYAEEYRKRKDGE